MSQKRKLEEYHDPDYPQNDQNKIARLESPEKNTTKISKEQRICDVLTREFETEINNKEREVFEINNRICLVRKMLHKVCFAVISNYYNKRNLNIQPEEAAQAQESISRLFTDEIKGSQSAVHPSLKKILGTNEVNYKELLNSRPTRQAAKTAQSTIKEKFKTKKEMRIERLRTKALESVQENITVDESLNQTTIVKEKLDQFNENNSSNTAVQQLNPIAKENKIQKLNTDRGINLSKHLIAVGNTSKFIQKESSLDKVTHKWLIYVQSKTEIPIEKFVRKVRFYLHPSYKPNDIVDVDFSPFQIARRGWGEFPVRIQLHFHSKFQQKPVQLFHNLVLDKTLTGLQTMGSETLLEVWLRSAVFSPHKLKLPETDSEICEPFSYTEDHNAIILKSPKQEYSSIKKEKCFSPFKEYKDNLIDFLNNIDPSLPSDLDSIEPTLILSPTTHTKLKISEVISSPFVQNSFNLNLRTENHPFVEKKISDNILLDDVVVKLEECENNFTKNFTNSTQTSKDPCRKLLFSETPAMRLSSNIQKINEKLKETIETKSEPTSISENCLRSEDCQYKHDPQKNIVKTQLSNHFHQNSEFVKHKSQIILKNGKVSIINPFQTKLKKQRKQISLLKPVIKQNQSNLNSCKKENLPTPWLTDHDYTSPWQDEKILQPNSVNDNINGDSKNNTLEKLKQNLDNPDLLSNNDFISVVISDNTKQLINLKKKITLTVKDQISSKENPYIDYRGKFELKFHTKKFTSESNLIEYCLKNVPLINSKAIDIHYKMAFPFVVENIDCLNAYSLPKQRALEWLQCKYFSTLMKNHGQFTETLWSTKEIILYARSYGFAPSYILNKITFNKNNFSKISTHSNLSESNANEKCDISVESIGKVYDWINKFNKNVEDDQNIEKINIDDYNDDNKNALKKLNSKKLSPLKYEENSVIIPIEEKYQNESKLIKELCDQIQISLKPEQIFHGIHSNISELILIKIFRKFLENLIRKAIFEFRNTSQTESIPVIEIDHVKKAILSHTDFNFLTCNLYKNLGKIKEEIVKH